MSISNGKSILVSRSEDLDYTPARLVKSDKWYVIWYERNIITKKSKRFRRTFNLAMIPKKRDREKHAKIHVDRINKDLAAGVFESLEGMQRAIMDEVVSLNDAFQTALDDKMLAHRKRTRECYASTGRIFFDYIHKKKIDLLPVTDFTIKHAIRFLDHIVRTRKIGPRTYNNYIINLRALFYVIARREMITKDKNPFVGIPKRKTGKKIRRAFTDREINIILPHIFANDQYLSLVIVLIYHCMIRPKESRFLRIKDLDLDRGVIYLSGTFTKNGDDSIVTIPDIIIPWLSDFGLDKYPKDYLIFGAGGTPHPSVQCGHNTLNLRHKKNLKRLLVAGLIHDIKGLSLYSWKDTGDQKLARSGVNIISIRDHNRHKSLSTTNAYMQSSILRDPEIAGLEYTIIPN